MAEPAPGRPALTVKPGFAGGIPFYFLLEGVELEGIELDEEGHWLVAIDEVLESLAEVAEAAR